MRSEHEWLTTLVPGTPVIVSVGCSPDKVSVVKRLTATQIVVQGEYERYSRADGHMKGGGDWRVGHLREATPARVEAIKAQAVRREALTQIGGTYWQALTTPDLLAVVAILNNAKASPDESA